MTTLPAKYDRVSLPNKEGVDERWYTTPTGLRPSITTVISATEPKQSRDRLQKIRDEDPERAKQWDVRRDQGNVVHNVLHKYFTGPTREWGEFLPVNMLLDEVGNPMPMWAATGVLESCEMAREYILSAKHARHRFDLVEQVVWSEGPLLEEHKQVIGMCPDHPRVWSDLNGGFAGCPDLRGLYIGNDTIVDIKTSEKPYRCSKPNAQFRTPEYWIQYNAWKKFQKAGMQLCAYDIGFQDSLRMPEAEQLTVLVITPDQVQLITLSDQQRVELKAAFLTRAEQFHLENTI